MARKKIEPVVDSPVLPPVVTRMRAQLIVNENADVCLVYDIPFTDTIKWAEYDLEDNRVVLVMLSGKIQPLGIVIPDEMRRHLQYGQQLCLIRLPDDKIEDMGMVPLIVRDVMTVH